MLPCILDVGAMDFAMPIGKYRGSKMNKKGSQTLDKNGTDLDQVWLLRSVAFVMLPDECGQLLLLMLWCASLQALRALQLKVLACCPKAKLLYENFGLLRSSEALHQSTVPSQKPTNSDGSGSSDPGGLTMQTVMQLLSALAVD